MTDQADDQTENILADLAESTEESTAESTAESTVEPTNEPTLESPAEASTEIPAEGSASETEEPTPTDPAIEASAPAEDSGVQGTMKAEAAKSSPKPPSDAVWRNHLKRFHDDVNGILATKENFKLVCVDKKAKDAFARTWKQESNKYFQLVVNLRRRRLGTKVGGKSVA